MFIGNPIKILVVGLPHLAPPYRHWVYHLQWKIILSAQDRCGTENHNGKIMTMEQKTAPGGKVEQGGTTVGFTKGMAQFCGNYGSVLGPVISPGPVRGGNRHHFLH